MSTPEKPQPPKVEKVEKVRPSDQPVSDIVKHAQEQVEETQAEPSNHNGQEMTEKDAEKKRIEIRKRLDAISSIHPRNHPSEAFGSDYTMLAESLGARAGQGKEGPHSANMPETIQQINCALACSEAPDVDRLLEEIEKGTVHRLDAAPLKEAAVLRGMKILDLGCGPKPTFARTARRLAADVYTLDIISSDEFISEILPPDIDEIKKVEAKKHIQIDLRDPEAFKKILEITNGDFDIVTSSWMNGGSSGHPYPLVENPDFFALSDNIMALLKKGGCWNREALGPDIKP